LRRVIAVFVVLSALRFTLAPADAANPHILSPTHIDTNLANPELAKALETEFSRQASIGALALGQQSHTFYTDPKTHTSYDLTALVAFSNGMQKLYHDKTNSYLKPNETLDLDLVASDRTISITNSSGTTYTLTRVKSLTFPLPAVDSKALVMQQSQGAPVVSLPPTDTPLLDPSSPAIPHVAPQSVVGNCASDNADPAAAIEAEWKALQSFTQESNICSLGAAGNSILATPSSNFPHATFSFGNSRSAEGTLDVSPSIDNSSGSLTASVEASLKASLLNSQSFSLLDGVASLQVPPASSNRPVATSISVGGAAFPGGTLYHSEGDLGQGPLRTQYSATPTKKYDFWTIKESWLIPVGPATTVVTATVTVSGSASLFYDIQGNANGLYVKLQPAIGASATGNVNASNGLCDCNLKHELSIQNGDSTAYAVAELINYKNKPYTLERVYAAYKPWTYQATVEAYGQLALFFHFDKFMFRTKPMPLGDGYTYDSGWQVQTAHGN
jgi:hypothetical protein